MTTEQDVARNAAAVRNLAARLERNGYVGDAHTEAEHIALNLLADGYARIEPVPPLVGTSSTEEGRAKARKLYEETLRARSAGMVVEPIEPIEPMPLCDCGHHNDRHGLGARCIKRLCSCPVYRPASDR